MTEKDQEHNKPAEEAGPYCEQCGSPVRSEDKFCPACSARFEKPRPRNAPEQQPTPTPPPPRRPAAPYTLPQIPMQPNVPPQIPLQHYGPEPQPPNKQPSPREEEQSKQWIAVGGALLLFFGLIVFISSGAFGFFLFVAGAYLLYLGLRKSPAAPTA
jgi:hypothetical protein